MAAQKPSFMVFQEFQEANSFSYYTVLRTYKNKSWELCMIPQATRCNVTFKKRYPYRLDVIITYTASGVVFASKMTSSNS